MLNIVVLPQADADIDNFYFFIGNNSESAAGRLLDNLEVTINELAEFPKMGAKYETNEADLIGVRWFPTHDFENHLIFYRADDKTLTVIRVLHSAQNIKKILS